MSDTVSAPLDLAENKVGRFPGITGKQSFLISPDVTIVDSRVYLRFSSPPLL